jgi:hypothetical protein
MDVSEHRALDRARIAAFDPCARASTLVNVELTSRIMGAQRRLRA